MTTSAKPLFQAPAYHTPADAKPGLAWRLLPGRLAFYGKILGIVLDARKLARRGAYAIPELIASSEATARAVEACGGRIHVHGLDKLHAEPEPAVFVANHMSSLETFLLPSIIGTAKPLTFVVKESLLTQPLFGHIMRAQRPIAVTRRNPREDLRKVLEDGVRILREEKRSIVVFPQTTRVFEFSEAQFNSLGIKLAARAGVPVMPIALRTDFWGNGSLVKEFGPVARCREVNIAFGDSIPITKANQQQAYAQVVDFIRCHLTEWGVPCAAADPGAGEAAG